MAYDRARDSYKKKKRMGIVVGGKKGIQGGPKQADEQKGIGRKPFRLDKLMVKKRMGGIRVRRGMSGLTPPRPVGGGLRTTPSLRSPLARSPFARSSFRAFVRRRH